MSAKHLHRNVNEFASWHNTRRLDIERMMEHTARDMVDKRLTYSDLTVPVPPPVSEPTPAGDPS